MGFISDGIPPLKVGSALGIPSPPAVLFPDGEVLTPSIEACERLQGFQRRWTAADGVSARARWRLVGNAVSVPVARWIATRIKAPGVTQEFATAPIENGRRWPDAGWNIGKGRVGIKASDQPMRVDLPSISTFRDNSWSRLSDRALNGFIRRAEEGGLRMPPGFLNALRSSIRKSKPAN